MHTIIQLEVTRIIMHVMMYIKIIIFRKYDGLYFTFYYSQSEKCFLQ